MRYITDILNRLGMIDCNNQKLDKNMCPASEGKKKMMEDCPYMEAAVCLQYLTQVSRPNICFAVNLISRFQVGLQKNKAT